VDELHDILDVIDRETLQQTGAISKGVSQAKNELEVKMVQTTITVAGLMYRYAFKTNNNELLVKANINKNTLYSLPDVEAIAMARSIAAEMNRFKNELEPYGVDESLRNELEQAIAGFQAALALPRDVIVEKKQYTGNLAKAFAEADSILYDGLDKLIVRFKTSDSAFYTDYRNARNLILHGTRRKDDKKDGDNK
jgi:glycine/D-amino acid oxidase-like deaminating enzyme